MIDIKDVEPGSSYACKYRILGMTGLGVIRIRDLQQELVELQDVESGEIYTVPFEDIWDVDTVEWQDAQ